MDGPQRHLVVVGVDGSKTSDQALAWAAAEARAVGAALRVVTAIRSELVVGTPEMGPWPAIDGIRDEAVAMQRDVLRAADTSGIEVSSVVELGHPARVLIEQAEGADLLVVGTRGHGTMAGLLLGSISHQVISHAHVPVVVVGDTAPPVRRIVVGVDGSGHALRALKWAGRFARAHAASLEAVSVVNWSAASYTAALEQPFPVPERDSVLEDARRLLDASVDQARLDDLVVDRIVAQGDTARELLHVAAEADLLVVGSRGRGGFTGLLLGSVSHRCVSHAPCPVAVVPGGPS